MSFKFSLAFFNPCCARVDSRRTHAVLGNIHALQVRCIYRAHNVERAQRHPRDEKPSFNRAVRVFRRDFREGIRTAEQVPVRTSNYAHKGCLLASRCNTFRPSSTQGGKNILWWKALPGLSVAQSPSSSAIKSLLKPSADRNVRNSCQDSKFTYGEVPDASTG